jgi:hypothetical protein
VEGGGGDEDGELPGFEKVFVPEGFKGVVEEGDRFRSIGATVG